MFQAFGTLPAKLHTFIYTLPKTNSSLPENGPGSKRKKVLFPTIVFFEVSGRGNEGNLSNTQLSQQIQSWDT